MKITKINNINNGKNKNIHNIHYVITMNKAETIARYGEAAWQKKLERDRARNKKYRDEHPEQIKANQHEANRKGGKYYEKNIVAQQTGIPGDKNKIRKKHRKQYHPYKMIIAPDSQLHHEWVDDTAEYRGIALVEADQHMHGFVAVIRILDGKITLLTEEEVKNGKNKEG